MARTKKASGGTGSSAGAIPKNPVDAAQNKPSPQTPDPNALNIDQTQPVRSDHELEWSGGLPLQLDRVMSDGRILRAALEADVGGWLDIELRNQEKLVSNIKKWSRQYSGKKEAKSYPYIGVNNLATPLTRKLTDAVLVRVFDAVWGQKKVWISTAKKPEFVDVAPQVEDLLDWWQKNIARLKTKLFSPMMQAIKTGTGIIFLNYTKKMRTVTRYAKLEEVANKKELAPYMTFLKTQKGQDAVKVPVTTFEGPDVMPVSREDFVISSDAESIDDAFLCGFRKYLREPEIKVKIKQGYYEKGVLDKLQPGDLDEIKEERAKEKGKEIGPEKKPYEIWQIWVKYDVDEDGEEDDIVVTIQPKTKCILRAIYNPFFNGFRPFVAIKGYPKEYSFDGEGTCEILCDLQEAKDAIHNQRLDRMDQMNGPMFVLQAGMINKFKTAPGMTWETDGDPNAIIKEIRFSDVYPSTFTEEGIIDKEAGEAVGVTPQVLGQSVSERPVAKDTSAMLQEANKKFKFIIDGKRDELGELGYKVVEMYCQYSPKYSYSEMGQEGMQQQQIQFPFDYLRDGLKIELTASSEILNKEVERERDLTVYQIMKDYDTSLASTVQAVSNPGIPSYFKMFLINESMISAKFVRRLLSDFDIVDAEELVLDIPTGLGKDGLTKAIMGSSDLQPPQPPGGQPGQPGQPQGGPGNGNPPQQGQGPQGPPQQGQ